MLGLLGVQFVPGMVTNLFISFPDAHKPDVLWAFARSQPWILAHIAVGLLLLAGVAVSALGAFQTHDTGWIIAAVVGAIAIVTAVLGGATFATSQVDAYSFGMALGSSQRCWLQHSCRRASDGAR
jgi:hypothetical protein